MTQKTPLPTELPARFRLGAWQADLHANRLHGEAGTVVLEPKTADLLAILAGAAGEVVTKDTLFATLWPDVTVGEDTLARLVSKLRRALGDSSRSPLYIETVSKRGYRLVAPVAPLHTEAAAPAAPGQVRLVPWRTGLFAAIGAGILVTVILLALPELQDQTAKTLPPSTAMAATSLADDRYMRFTRADNEAAIMLYERAAAAAPGDAGAYAGLANALVQRVIRWPDSVGLEAEGALSLTDALRSGLTTAPQAALTLDRAQGLAERAVSLDPENADHWRALGLVSAAKGDLGTARSAYEAALTRDPDHWPSLLNLGELDALAGRQEPALDRFEAGYAAMEARYREAPQRIGPWLSPMGVMIAERHEAAGRPAETEIWYRRVLENDPLNGPATRGLAELLAETGAKEEAEALCAEAERRRAENVCQEGEAG